MQTEDQIAEKSTEKLKQKFTDKIKLRQYIAFHLAMQMEYPGYGTLPVDDFEDFVNHPLWQGHLSTTSLEDVNSKINVKELTVLMTKWNNKRHDLHFKNLREKTAEEKVIESKTSEEKSSRTAYNRFYKFINNIF